MINAAIVGLGWWGKTLVESGENSKALRFVAAATRTQSPEVKAFVEQKGLRLAANYEALLADPQIDAVVLATPHSMHAAQVIAAAGAKKHIFCEKPFTLTKREAEDAVAAVRKAGVTLGLGYNRRFHPEMTKLREHDPRRRSRHHPAHRGDDDVPQCAVHQPRLIGAPTRRRRRAAA